MKTVFTDLSTIAHIWANQTQDNARNSSSNFYFDGNTIYSYGRHFPIAKHVTNEMGEHGTLFTERGYSVTTSKHISIVRDAANHKNIIYCFNPESTHTENLNSWIDEAENIAANLLKAKKPEKYLSQLSYVNDKVNKYVAFFNLAIPEKLQLALSIRNKDQYKEYAAKKEQFEQAEKKRQKIELEKKHKKELAAWIKGETHRLYNRNGYDYLRLSENIIETTQAIQIPLPIAKELYFKIKNNEAKIGDKVLSYTINEIGKEIKIGCHNFKTSYLLEFGARVFN